MNAMRWRDIGLGLQSGVRRLHPGVWIAIALVLLALALQCLVVVDVTPQLDVVQAERDKVEQLTRETPFTTVASMNDSRIQSVCVSLRSSCRPMVGLAT